MLDALLLDVLDHEPAELGRAFARLFAAPRGPGAALLDENSRVLDDL
jgi:hypothetical protein